MNILNVVNFFRWFEYLSYVSELLCYSLVYFAHFYKSTTWIRGANIYMLDFLTMKKEWSPKMSGKHFRTPDVRLVRLMSNVGEPHVFYMQRYT